METDIFKFILTNQGAVDTSDLLFDLCDASTLFEIISKNDKFVSWSFNGTPKVVVRTPMRLCRVKECPPGRCGDLHLCKNFLLSGVCPFSQRRRGCLFSHDLNSFHNIKVLRECGLETLTRPELCLLLLQSDSTLLPPICFDYNKGDVWSGQCLDSCHRLHICEKYLNVDCTCSRTHDFFAAQPLKILRERQIPDHLIRSLRPVYANKEALRLADKKAGRTARMSSGNVGSSLAKRAFSCGDLLGAIDAEMDGVSRRSKHKQRDKTEICMYFIKGHCKYEDQCFKAHDKMPYRWEMKQSGQWTPMADNETIEKDYCDPQNTYSTTSPPVHFDTMTCGADKVRRLSTVNSVLEPDFIHTTDWLWYWEDEDSKWCQYEATASEHRLASITSKQLEEMFMKNDKDVVEFTAGSHQYSLSFQDLIQTNLKFGTKRLVRRRPQFVSATEVQTKRKRPTKSTAVPDYWDKRQMLQTGYKRVSLQSSSEEYKEIQELFSQTMSEFNIIQIERIQNKELWEAFQLQKSHMENNNGRKPVLEKKLFHGTDPQFVDTICAKNFDWRVCGVNGTSYGHGSYFARDAKYSHSYTGSSDVRFLFVSRVLVGQFTKGCPEFKRPPSKDEGHVNLFDSCVNNVDNPSIFVVFEKHQIYPEYLLQYERKQISPATDLVMRQRNQLDALKSNMKAPVTNAGIFGSAPLTHSPRPIAKPRSLTKEEMYPKLQGRDLLKEALAFNRKQQDAIALNTKTPFTEHSAFIVKPKPALINENVINPTPPAQARGFTNLTQDFVTCGENLLDVPIRATVPGPTLTPTTAEKPKVKPKPVVIPSCFTTSSSSSSSASLSRSIASSSRSSTSASYAYMLECLKKL